MTIPFKSRPVEFHQHQLFPSNIFDLDGSKFKADTSKHKAMSYARLKEKEQALCAEIDALIEQASRCDREEDQAYRDKTGYEIPEDLQFKQERLAKSKPPNRRLKHAKRSSTRAKPSQTASRSVLPIPKRGSWARMASSSTAITEPKTPLPVLAGKP